MNEDSQTDQPRQYGDEVNTDPGLAQLSQAQTDEAAMAIEASLLDAADEVVVPIDQIEGEETVL